MKVPINPDTDAPAGALGYEKPVDISAGTRALGEVVSKWADYADQQQKKRQMFDVEQKVVNETNDLSQDFEAKKQAQPIGAPNFVQQVNGEYNTRHQAMVQQLKDQGYSPDAVHEFAQRLGTIRAQYVAQAIDFQTKSEFSKTLNDADQMGISLSQYVNTNPNAINSALSSFRTGLSFSGLEKPEQEQIYESKKGVIIKSAQDGFALQHPEAVLGLYGLPNEITSTSPTNLPAGQQFDLPSYLQKLNPVEGTGKNPKSSAKGYGQFLDSTWLGTYKQVYGNTNETDAQILAKKTDLPTATRLTQQLTNNNIQTLVQDNKPVNDTTVYLSHFLGIGDALKVLNAHADATISGLIHPASIAANSKVFNKVKTVGDLLSWAQNKMGDAGQAQVQQQQAALTPIPANWRGNQEDAIRELGMTADQAATYLTTGKDTRVAPTVSTVSKPRLTVGQPQASMDAAGQTGIPILDMSTGSEREQMVVIARKVMNEREADAKATQQDAHQAWLNGFLNHLQDGTIGQSDLNTAYANGQFATYEERERAQNIIDAKNKNQDALTLFNTMLHQGGKFNPFDDTAQKAADAGFDNTVKWAQKNDPKNYNPFAIAVEEWQRVGILPKQGAVMMRGALIGTDPGQVAQAASVAANMLKQNPNAFAGVDGGEEIGKAAANYTHYVDDLGMPAQAAANKIALANSPEFQAKLQANRPAREQFVTSIVGDGKNNAGIDIQKTLNDAILGPRGWGSTLTLHAFDPAHGTMTGPQTAEARQTYLELALENYDKFGDPAAAQAYATQQMSRFYGIESGRMMKYPATKAYPEIMGSTEYVFDQAKQFVDKAAGFSVPKEDISLMPTATGSTADAFRNGKAPPYQVVYVTRTNGQPVYHTIPDKVFVADVGEARTAAAAAARKIELQHRNTVVFPGIGPVEGPNP